MDPASLAIRSLVALPVDHCTPSASPRFSVVAAIGNKPSKEQAPGYLAEPSSDCCLKSTVHEGQTSYRRDRDLHSKTTRGRGKRRHYPRVLFLTDNPGSATGLESKFSIYHAAAIALLYEEATPSQFLDDVAQNSTVIELRGKVHVTSDDTVEKHEAFVSATFADGTTLDVHVEHTIGSYENPLTTEQLKSKFPDQAGTVIGSTKAAKAWVMFSTIVNATDVSEAVRLSRTSFVKTFQRNPGNTYLSTADWTYDLMYPHCVSR